MVRRGIQRVETMVFVFDFGPIGDYKTNLSEASDYVLGDLRQRMKFAQGAAASGQSEISWFLGQSGVQFEFAGAVGSRPLRVRL